MRGVRRICVAATAVALAVLANVAAAEAGKPVVRSVSPVRGPTTGHTVITIDGERLLPVGVESCAQCAGVVVQFGTTAAAVLVGSQKQLKVQAPPHDVGTVDVTVATPGGVSASGLTVNDHFTYFHSPQVTVTSPASGSVTGAGSEAIAGGAGVDAGDLPTITVTLFAGPAAGTPIESHFVQASAGRWSTSFGPLGSGTYSVRAEQRDEAGTVGRSEVVTFTVRAETPTTHAPIATALGAAPFASFTWFPAVPQAGEVVSLVSSSSDAQSPLTAFAWDLTGSGSFAAAGPLLTTSFPTAGAHVVRLRVTGGNGLSSVAGETIVVRPRHADVMQPFPVVRILGSYGAFGAQLVLLTVAAPADALITVVCRGHGCPVRGTRRHAPRSAGGIAVVAFRRFERRLPGGVTLVIRVSAPGEIGKYTRFAIRRGRPPQRVDACLSPGDPRPMACPSS
jgi:hypothetical protein